MAHVSMAEYARMRGITEGTVRLAIKTGKLKISVIESKLDKKRIVLIDSESADKEWPREDYEIKRQLERGELIADMEQARNEKAEAIEKVAALSNDYAKSRADREAYNAQLARLKYEEQSGKLIDAEEVRKEAFKIGRAIRDTLMSIPDRVSAEFAAETNQFRIHARISEEIRKALSVLKDEE